MASRQAGPATVRHKAGFDVSCQWLVPPSSLMAHVEFVGSDPV